MEPRRKKTLIYAGLAVLFIADGTFAYFSSKISSGSQNPQQELQAENRQLQLMKLDVKSASEIRAKIPQVLKEFDQFEAALPTAAKGYSTIDQELSQFAKETHLQVDEKKFHEKDLPGRGLTEIEIEETVAGDYTGIVSFLNRLQRSKNTYVIDGLQVDSQNAGQGAPGTLKIELKLLTYFRKA
jgi:predicted ribosomally synthesized peptide with SipW-like signal peptide